MTAIRIREATRNDVDDLVALLVEFSAVHATGMPHIYQPVSVDAETTAYLHRVMALAQTHLFVAEVADQVVGLLIVQEDEVVRTPVHVPRQWAVISVLVVHEASRQQGIGTALIEYAQAWAGERGIDTVELMVAEFNTAAIRWYESLGYTTRERRMVWCRDNEDQDHHRPGG